MTTAFVRTLSLLLLLVLLGAGSVAKDAFARRNQRSFSTRSTSSPTAGTRSKGIGFSSSTSGTSYSSRSTSHSKKGSIFSADSKKTRRGTDLADAARRAESQSKFHAAGGGMKSYKEVVKSDDALRAGLTVGNAQSRNKRRTDFYNSTPPQNERYYQYRPNVFYRDPYDSFFFRYVTLAWLFHHWNNIDPARFNAEQLQELEREFAEMEAQGLKRDPGYSLEGAEPDLQYSDAELVNLQDAVDVLEFESAPETREGGVVWLTIFLVGLVGLGGFYFAAVRKS